MPTMTELDVEQEANGKEQSPLFDVARKLLLAGVGAVALTQDEIEKLIDKLVERGEIAEKDGRKLVREAITRRRKKYKGVEDQVDRRAAEILDRLNVPTKADIQALSDRIAALSAKLDELKRD
jgi:poly(hydroxyalkanoate) granule-associated protein